MAVTATSIFVQAPLQTSVLVTTAVTSRAKTTTLTNFVAATAASTNGIRVDAITVKPAGTSAAGLIFIWIFDGTDCYLFDEIAVNAITPSNTAAADATTKIYNTSANPPLQLPPTYRLYVTTTITQNVNVITSYWAF